MTIIAAVNMSRPLALLVGGALVPVAYALQWLGAKVLDWWTKPAPKGQQ